MQIVGEKRQADPVMPEDFGEIATAPTENVQVARVRVALQLFLHLKRQPLHAAPHVRVAGRDPDPAARRQRDHRRSAFTTRDSAAVSTSDHTRIRSPLGEHDLHLASRPWSGIFRRRVWRNCYGQDRREFLRRGRDGAELPTPGEELVGVEIVPPRDLGDRSSLLEALVDYPPLLFETP